CFLSLIYGEDSEEIKVLRHFRDEALDKTPEGKETIRVYYKWSTEILRIMEEDEKVKEVLKAVTDGILPLIKTSVELSEGDTSTSTMVGGHRGKILLTY
ncbi:MAG: CFI-box-CTERM domain-containing protein, partial [Thermodesulfobacteriota bacterium]